MKQTVIQLHPKDNVLVALQHLQKGTIIHYNEDTYTLQDNINAKHKFYTNKMSKGHDIYMYGVLVGNLQCDVAKGTVMTSNNIKHASSAYKYNNCFSNWAAPDVSKFANKTFMGYKRNDGRVGTANYWLFIPTVFCENRNLDIIREALHSTLGYAVSDKYLRYTDALLQAFQNGNSLNNIEIESDTTPNFTRYFKNVDGIKFLTHHGGCGGTRQDAAILSALLAAYADHPNVGGVTILSLGCQHLEVVNLLDDIKKRNPHFNKPLFVFEQQQSVSEEQMIAAAIKKTFEGLIEINKLHREPAPLSALCIGVKCGGSDGFSGISANPAVGHTADIISALGGKILLAEFPELCGAEQDLIDRCTTEASAKKFIKLMKAYDASAHAVGSGFYMNPSPGNIREGLITDAIKSVGAARKGGSSPITDVLDYTEAATKPGLNLVCTPGNDVEATTGQAASGATLILFTTGMGTPTGNAVCPTIKIASNTPVANRMSDIIDMDCGPIISGEKTIEEMGEDILAYCIKAASGNIIPKAVLLNQDDFIPWKRGVSL